MKRFYFIFFAVAILLGAFASQAVGQSTSKLNMSVRLNQLVYKPSDMLEVTVKIQPKEDIPDVRVALKVGEKDKLTYARTHYFGNLPEGKEQVISFNKKTASSFGLESGRNHILVELTSKQKIYSKFATDLGVIDEEADGNLKVAFAIKVADKPHIDMDKNVTDTIIQKKLLPLVEKYQQLSTKHKGFFSFILSPLLMDTIERIANGYNLVENGNIVSVPDSSPSSVKAKSLKEGFMQLFKNGDAGLILSPYSQVHLERLTSTALKDQLDEGKKILDHYNQPYVATYPAKDFSPSLLKGRTKEEATLKALAYLVEAHNTHKGNLVLVTTQMVKPEYISHFIASAKKQPWLKLKPITDLNLTKKMNKLPKKAPTIKELAGARRNYFVLKESLASENAVFEKAKMAIYLAEDKNTDGLTALTLANQANKLLSQELKRISLKLSPLTLTGRYGKLPIRVVNDTESTLNLNLELQSENFEFKQNNKSLVINPKENLISIPVKVVNGGKHKILVTLRAKDAVISKKYLVVSTSLPSTFWYYIGSVLIVMLLLFIGAFYVREKRSKRAASS